MKTTRNLCFIVFLALIACGKTSEKDHAEHGESAPTENPNQPLYDQVMDVHDEVMPAMDEIERLKRTLRDKIANTPDMIEERKAELERVISNLDSASNSMMDWMHEFNPLPDSADQEKARAYLESEMERIKKVKDRMTESIEKAKEEVKN